MTTGNDEYLHGYSPEEQDRLITQSQFLEPWIYRQIDFRQQKHVIEVGCGVGAQLKILARRFPQLQLTGVDRSEVQLQRARMLLAPEIEAGRVHLQQGKGAALPFADQSFDGAFLCWLLEHVAEPVPLLRELRRVMKPGAQLFVTEVFNASLFTDSKATSSAGLKEYWAIFNSHQEQLGGHPNLGPQLGNLLNAAGFKTIVVEPIAFQFDGRLSDPGERQRFMTYFREVFLSAVPQLKAAKLITDRHIKALISDLALIEGDLNSVFYINAIQARASN